MFFKLRLNGGDMFLPLKALLLAWQGQEKSEVHML